MSERMENALSFFLDSIMNDSLKYFDAQKNIKQKEEWREKKKSEIERILREHKIDFSLEEFFSEWESLEFKKSKFMYILGLQDGITFLGELEKAKETE